MKTGIDVKDVIVGAPLALQDPTELDERVAKSLTNKLAELLTKVEEAVGQGDSDIGVMQFASLRGELLDSLDDPEVVGWLKGMRLSARCPHRRYRVGS